MFVNQRITISARVASPHFATRGTLSTNGSIASFQMRVLSNRVWRLLLTLLGLTIGSSVGASQPACAMATARPMATVSIGDESIRSDAPLPAESVRPEPATGRRPNVVFIMADDLGWGEVGCYGQEKIPTPNIDRLATQGTRFTQHYSGAPVCAPSRCVLLSGKHSGHAQIRGNQQAKKTFPQFNEGQHPITADVLTIAEVFQQQGYRTAAMGKWGLGPVGSTGDPNQQGFDLFVGYNCQAVAHSYFARFIWENDQRIEINPQPIPGHKKQPEGSVEMETYLGQTYAPQVMIDRAIQFIEEANDEPFFLYLPLIEPHVAMHPPRASVEKFPLQWDEDVYRGESGYLPHPRPRAAYAAMISDVDSYVARVMQALEKTGVADNTLVVFTSDNGTTHEGRLGTRFHVGGCDADFFNSTAGLRGYKGSVYEGGIRVPMIVRYPPAVAAGKTNDTPSYFADWFPTLCAVIDAKTPEDLDGENLWPVMTGEANVIHTDKDRKPMVWVFPEYGGQVAIRLGDYKVLHQKIKQPKAKAQWEVYNIALDPNETTDLAADLYIRDPTVNAVLDQAIEVLNDQTSDNAVFPLTIPAR